MDQFSIDSASTNSYYQSRRVKWRPPARLESCTLSLVPYMTERAQGVLSNWIKRPCPFLLLTSPENEDDLNCLCAALYRHFSYVSCIRYANEADFYTWIRASDKCWDSYARYIAECDLLIVTEWLLHTDADWKLKILRSMISTRLDDMLPTIFATTMPAKEWASVLQHTFNKLDERNTLLIRIGIK